MCVCVCISVRGDVWARPIVWTDVTSRSQGNGDRPPLRQKEKGGNGEWGWPGGGARGERKWVKGAEETGVDVRARARARERGRERETWRVASRGVLIVAQHPREPFLPTAANLPTYPKHSTPFPHTPSAVTRLPPSPSPVLPFVLFIHSPAPPPFPSPFSAPATNPFSPSPPLPKPVLPVALLDRSWRNPVRHPSSCIQRVNY